MRTGRILRKVLSLSNLVKSNAEFEEMLDVWASTLIETVPEEKLDVSLSRAIKNHKSVFPVNAFEVLQAFEEIEAEESARREQYAAEDRALNKVLHCPDKHNHQSESEALQEYLVGEDFAWLPCATCRSDAYWQRVKDIKSKLQSEKSNIERAEEMLSEQTENNVIEFKEK